MANIVTIVSSKGGAGKTTVSLNLAVALAERGCQTLLVDLDPQGAVGLSLKRGDTEWAGLVEMIMGRFSVEEAIFQTRLPALSVLPRGRLHPRDACEYERAIYESPVLAGMLERLGNRFQFIILDTPSGLGMITRSALAISTHALLPLQAEPLAARSLVQTLQVIEHVRQEENPGLQLLGILPTMVQMGQESSLNVLYAVWSGFAAVLETHIPRDEIFLRASDLGLPLSFMGGRIPPDAKRFELLAAEIETRIQHMNGSLTEERKQRELV